MKLTVLNDLHLGVQRAGGTTPASAEALREFAQQNYTRLLAGRTHVAINGDMFDTYQVPTSDLLYAYISTAVWLRSGGERLHLIPGNHDLAKNSANLSSFELLARLLIAQFPTQVSYHAGGTWVDEGLGIYAISHVPNQDLFELELARVPEGTKYLLLHCNYDNKFAGAADHSLNLERSVAKELTRRGMTLILGHEHQHRTLMGDKVIIVGNQFPTSVSDCLAHGDAQKDGCKYLLEIDGDDMELVTTWNARASLEDGTYREIDWQDLAATNPVDKGYKLFIRVTGKATAEQGADVIKAISKFRQSTDHFVVTNAVKVESIDSPDDLAESVEDIRSVSVLDLLLEQLTEPERAVVRQLLSGETA